MIDTISLFGLLLISFVGYTFDFFDFKELYCSAYGALLLFMIFGRCFMTISANQMIAEKNRLKIEVSLFFLATICLIFLCLYDYPRVTSKNNIRLNPSIKNIVAAFECLPCDISGISSSTTT